MLARCVALRAAASAARASTAVLKEESTDKQMLHDVERSLSKRWEEYYIGDDTKDLKDRKIAWDVEKYHWFAGDTEARDLSVNIKSPSEKMVKTKRLIEAYHVFCKQPEMVNLSTDQKRNKFDALPEAHRAKYVEIAVRMHEARMAAKAKAPPQPKFKTYQTIVAERTQESEDWDL